MSYKLLSPIEKLFDSHIGNFKCVKCGAKAHTCNCWTKCNIKGCTWSYETGTKCGNPKHNKTSEKMHGKKY